MGQLKTCPSCSREFEPARTRTKFCSRPCQLVAAHEARRSVPDAECETCHTAFRPRQNASAGRYCSRPCLYAGMSGSSAPNWKGGRAINSSGYVTIYAPDHPSSHRRSGHGVGYVLEHRFVMEQVLGRFLREGETVHHINGDKADNRPENLQLRQGRHGKGVVYQCNSCGSSDVAPALIAAQAGG